MSPKPNILVGSSDYPEFIEKKALFVDITAYIYEFMNCGAEVVAILRPRRFGNTFPIR